MVNVVDDWGGLLEHGLEAQHLMGMCQSIGRWLSYEIGLGDCSARPWLRLTFVRSRSGVWLGLGRRSWVFGCGSWSGLLAGGWIEDRVCRNNLGIHPNPDTGLPN